MLFCYFYSFMLPSFPLFYLLFSSSILCASPVFLFSLSLLFLILLYFFSLLCHSLLSSSISSSVLFPSPFPLFYHSSLSPFPPLFLSFSPPHFSFFLLLSFSPLLSFSLFSLLPSSLLFLPSFPSPLSPPCPFSLRIKQYLGPVQLHFIKDSWSVRGEGK